MFLAPTVNLSGRLVPAPEGTAGVAHTLRIMRQLVRDYRTNLDVRGCAVNVIFLTPAKNDAAEIDALFSYVRDNIRYVRDILDVETIATPDKTILMGYGDCDDKTVLLASLAESVGYPTRFVVAGYNTPGALEHVYLQILNTASGEWIDCDATESMPMGFAPPDPVTLIIEEI